MARPLSAEKRLAILAAAARVIGEQGLGASTSRIAHQANVAEGSLFTYFANKDILLNAVYLHIKSQLAAALFDGYPHGAAVRTRAAHVWHRYVNWGLEHSAPHQAMLQLGVSEKLTAASRAEGMAMFSEIVQLLEQHTGPATLSCDGASFAGAIFGALAETAMEFIAREPAKAEHYAEAGFNAFWRAVALE